MWRLLFFIHGSLVVTTSAFAVDVLWSSPTTLGYADSSAGVADVDGDGVVDVVVTTTGGGVVALDRNGRQIWMRGVQIPISLPPTVVDLTEDGRPEILVLNQAGQLFCLDGKTGDPLWDWSFPGSVAWGSTSIVARDLDGDGRIEIISGDERGTIVCLSSAGAPLWSIAGDFGQITSPAVGDVTGDERLEILVGSLRVPLICLSAAGEILWKLDRTGPGASPVVVDVNADGKNEIVAGFDNELAAVRGDGTVMWTQPMRKAIDSSICVADANEDGIPEIYAADLSGDLICVDPAGQPRWAANMRERIRRSPAIVDSDGDGSLEILVAGYSGELHVFDAHGNLKETFDLGGPTNATPSVVDFEGNGRPAIVIPLASGRITALQWSSAAPGAKVAWPEYRFSSDRAAMPVGAVLSSPVRITSIDFGTLYVGSNDFRVEIGNPEQRELLVRIEVLDDQEQPRAEEWKSSDRAFARTLRYIVPADRTADLTMVCIVTADGKPVARQSAKFFVTPFVKEAADLKARLGEVGALLRALPAAYRFRGLLADLTEKAEALRERAAQAGTLNEVDRRTLREGFSEALSRLKEMEPILRAADEARRTGHAPLLLSGANPWAPFGGMAEIGEKRLAPADIQIEAFRGEIESAAINLFNLGEDHLSVRIEPGPLRSGDGREISWRDVVTLHETMQVPTQTLDFAADAIPALNQANTLTVPAWEARQLWIKVDTRVLGAGDWTIPIRFKSLDIAPVEVSAIVTVRVWQTALPEKQALRLCQWGYVDGSLLRDQPDAALQDQVSHHTNVFTISISPSATYDENGDLVTIDFKAHDEYVRRHAPHGMILFQYTGGLSGPGGTESEAYRKAHIAWLREWVKHLAGMGVGYDGFALYPVDEPGLNKGLVDIYLFFAKLAREADPKIQMYTDPVARITMDELKEMAPYVDIWCPNRVGFLLHTGGDKLELMKSTGATMWNYECEGNAKHQSPLGYYRGQSWLAWHHGLTGIGFWSYCTSSADPWYTPGDTSDYLLIYSGERVVSSKRWEAVRDGVEDYTMLALLRDTILSARGAPDSLVSPAEQLLGNDASAIARFCGLDEHGTVPGKGGLPRVREIEDERWRSLQETRRTLAELLSDFAPYESGHAPGDATKGAANK